MNGPLARVRLAAPLVGSDEHINEMWRQMAESVAFSRAYHAELSRKNPIFWPPPS